MPGLTIREAVSAAESFLESIYPEEAFEGLEVEELYYDDEHDEWVITMGLLEAPAEFGKPRYKVVRLSAVDGEIRSMHNFRSRTESCAHSRA